jgi:Rod binding domain-containing protein
MSTAVASAVAAAGSRKPIDKESKLYQQCVEFESLFVKIMLKSMRDSVQKTGLLDGGMAEDIFSDMLYDQYALSMSRNASFGLADQIYAQLTASPEGGSAASEIARQSLASRAASAYAAAVPLAPGGPGLEG